jgi:hypothetical protein
LGKIEERVREMGRWGDEGENFKYYLLPPVSLWKVSDHHLTKPDFSNLERSYFNTILI